MNFDEWFEKNYPYGYAVLPRSAGEQLAREAWEAGFQAGQDHQQELERLTEYDRNSFMFDYR
jgi:hypothetical protein